MKALKNSALFLASGCYSGYLKPAPGTCGSVAFAAIWLAIATFYPLVLSSFSHLLLAGVVGLGLVSTHLALDKDEKDPGHIVIDEWAGLMVTYYFFTESSSKLLFAIVGLVLFRLFDITKLWPVYLFERLPGAFGIMADDIVAGLMAGLCILLPCWLNLLCL